MVGKCASLTRDGKPCSATPRPGSAYCAWHDPELSKRRSEWSARGGANRSNRSRAKRQLPEAMETGELGAWLAVVFRKLIAGGVEPGVATAAASLSRAMIEVARAAHVEDRIAEIERALGITERSAS